LAKEKTITKIFPNYLLNFYLLNYYFPENIFIIVRKYFYSVWAAAVAFKGFSFWRAYLVSTHLSIDDTIGHESVLDIF